MDKRFWAIIGIIILVFVGFVLLRDNNSTAPATNAKPTSHTRGEGEKVTLVEYGDFQCPACAQYFPIVEQVIDKYSDDITFQFRHFPLISIHPNAFASSRAAEAASKQDKFWEMYEKLYAGQGDWSSVENPNSIFETYAKQIGLDIEQYKKDFTSTEVNDAINADRRAGEKLDVSGTPTFVLNGKVIETPAGSIDEFSKLIDAELEKKQ